MKIAVAGKGGSGKTTVSAILARTLAADGHRVLAVDADTNPNLGLSLGLGVEETFELIAARDELDQEDADHASTMAEIIDRFSREVSDRLRLLQIGKIERPDPG